MRFTVQGRQAWLLLPVTPLQNAVEVLVPLCPACQERIRQHQAQVSSRGLSLGAMLGGTGAILTGLALGQQKPNTLMLLAVGGLAIGGLVGFLLGSVLGFDLPVQVRYASGRGTLALRFRNAGYAAQVLEAMKAKKSG
jgi:hypothetical protein